MKAELRLRDIAVLEEVSLRQVQRWTKRGDLCSFISGKERKVRREDYLAWKQKREALAQPNPDQRVEVPKLGQSSQVDPHQMVPVPAPVPAANSLHPAWNRASDLNAPLTNCPNEHSSNSCSPEVLREHLEEEARQMLREFRGDTNGTPEEYDIDYQL